MRIEYHLTFSSERKIFCISHDPSKTQDAILIPYFGLRWKATFDKVFPIFMKICMFIIQDISNLTVFSILRYFVHFFTYDATKLPSNARFLTRRRKPILNGWTIIIRFQSVKFNSNFTRTRHLFYWMHWYKFLKDTTRFRGRTT